MSLTEHDPDGIVALSDQLLFIVKLVLDIAYDLLQYILHRDDTRSLSVLIDHDRHVHVLILHLMEQIVYVQRIGNHQRLARDIEQRAVLVIVPCVALHYILQMDDSDDIVDVARKERESRKALARHELHRALDVHLGIDRHDLRPVRHYVARLLLVKFYDIRDHLGFLGLEYALFLGLIDHGNDLVFCYDILGIRIEAGYLQQNMASHLEAGTDRCQNHRDHLHQTEQPEEMLLGLEASETVGNDVRKQHHEVNEHDYRKNHV